MLKVLTMLVSKGKYGLRSILGKVLVTRMTCKHPELTNEKVKFITDMMN